MSYLGGGGWGCKASLFIILMVGIGMMWCVCVWIIPCQEFSSFRSIGGFSQKAKRMNCAGCWVDSAPPSVFLFWSGVKL